MWSHGFRGQNLSWQERHGSWSGSVAAGACNEDCSHLGRSEVDRSTKMVGRYNLQRATPTCTLLKQCTSWGRPHVQTHRLVENISLSNRTSLKKVQNYTSLASITLYWLLFQRTWVPATTWRLITITLVPEDLMPSDLFVQQAHTWYTEIQAGKTSTWKQTKQPGSGGAHL